jgi:hypothetical protein
VVGLDLSLSKTLVHIDLMQTMESDLYMEWVLYIGIARGMVLAFRGSQPAFALTSRRY